MPSVPSPAYTNHVPFLPETELAVKQPVAATEASQTTGSSPELAQAVREPLQEGERDGEPHCTSG